MNTNLYKQLKTDLGEVDAINEYIEVIVRQFEDHKWDEDDFQKIASKYGIRVNEVSPDKAILKIRLNYILAVHQIVENFADNFLQYQKAYGKDYRSRDQRESYLLCAYKNIYGSNHSHNNLEPSLLFAICDYYRLIRNSIAHVNDKDLTAKYEALTERKEEIKKLYNNLDAPNSYENISFDDFLLFSRAAKNLAEHMIQDRKIDHDKIAGSLKKNCGKFLNNEARLQKYIRTSLKENYFVSSEDDVNRIIEKVVQNSQS